MVNGSNLFDLLSHGLSELILLYLGYDWFRFVNYILPLASCLLPSRGCCATILIGIFDGISKVKNIGFDGYIGIWIYGYIDGYFYMNINISKINKNILTFIKILYKSVKMTIIIKYTY